MFAVFNRAISRRSRCTLWRNSSMMVATVQFYTRGVRAVHKTEHLSAVLGSIAPVTPIYVRIYVEEDDPNTAPKSLANIQYVLYELHPSFKNRLRRSESANANFEIKIWTYGWFLISATVIPKSGT